MKIIAIVHTLISLPFVCVIMADEKAYTIDLSGIPGKYSLARTFRFKHQEWWYLNGRTVVKVTPKKTREIHIPTEMSLNAITFLSRKDGIIVGDKGTVFVTRNNGSTWKITKVPARGNLQQISCIKNGMCWVLSSDLVDEILVTKDKGETWELIHTRIGSTLNSIFWVNQTIGFSLTTDGKLYKTKDEGKSWLEIPIQVDTGTDAITELNRFLYFGFDELYFLNEKVGWIASPYFILRTSDGGKTWNQFSYKDKRILGIIGFKFINASRGWAIGNFGFNLCTSNGGRRWKRCN